ncbi:HNH endonuclease signature motif containing protein [Accumulibacter sp.]|jgi:hypothetical protein|uniref:HNH endonuclease signature motif containing protein n=1 Tax=Accumulibacter sp. TaxID=2053492 RepID=UPI002D098D9C|nr:HNH endonuclease signature motif containing protein [Accumulibacter sp.]HRF06306.1 HNH endonuclease signature motif containing protein [Accumulibacter sp.]
MSTARKPRISWTAEMKALVAKIYPDTPTADVARRVGVSETSVYAQAAVLGIRKSAAYMASTAACRLRRGDNVGAKSRFRKGANPWNKGMKGLQLGGVGTRFQPGHVGGRAAEVYQPIGTERITRDGYLERKIHDGLPRQSRWRAVHLLLWEEANGRVPPGHAIAFRDGDKRNLDLVNLHLVSRAELMRRNSCHNYGPEMARLVQLKSAIARQINKREKQS